MKIILKSLDIINFRGISHFSFDFKEKTNVLSAHFGYGKTTIKEAFLWGLGLPIQNVKPCKFEKNRWVEIAHLEPSVEMTLQVITENDTSTLKLQRQVKGTQTIFYIDDEKLTALQEYQRLILEHFELDNIETLKDLTIVGHFMQRDNKEIRKILFDISHANEVLIDTQNSYDTLKQDFIDGLTTEEISLNIKRELKNVENEQTIVRAHIETYRTFLNNHTDMGEDLEIKKARLLDLKKQTQNDMDLVIKNLNDRLADIENKILLERDRQDNLLRGTSEPLNQARYNITLLEKPIKDAREKYETIQAREIDEVLICPTCGQSLPKGNSLTQKLAKQKEIDLANAKRELDNLLAERKRNEDKIAECQMQLNEINEQKTTIELSTIKQGILTKMRNLDELLAPQKQYIQDLDNELIEINSQIKTNDIVKEQKTLMQQAQKKLKELLVKTQNIYKKSDDLKDYLSKIENIITKRVNDFFLVEETGLGWKLYENAKNGNLQTSAELMYKNAKQYSTCSRGEQLDADCQLLFFLQDSFNLELPIFIDNITDLGGFAYQKDKQIIYLQTNNKTNNFELESVA